MIRKNYVSEFTIVTVVVLFQIINVYGNVSDYGEECNYTAECIDHRMICSINENNVSICMCDRFHEWKSNVTGCVERYNISTILHMVIFIEDTTEYERSKENIFFAQKVAGYFVLCICGLAVIVVMLYCCYVKKTDLVLKESLKTMKNASRNKPSTHEIEIKHV